MDNTGEIIKALRDKAAEYEDIGDNGTSCGLLVAARWIDDEIGDVPLDNEAIGGSSGPALDYQREQEYKDNIYKLQVKCGRLMETLAGHEAMLQAQSAAVAKVYHYQEKQQEYQDLITARVPRCSECNGTGTVKPMFYEYDCPKCGGTGVQHDDVAQLVAVQQQMIRELQVVIEKQRADLFNYALSEEEKTAISMTAFWSDAKTNWRGD